MKFRLTPFLLLGLVAFFVAACDRVDTSSFTAEADEPGYRRGKDLIRQGRNQEALAEFQRVLEKRGLNGSPETHLEMGLLYHQHIHDPIAAIYHFRKFRELKPNAQQAELVRQRIDAATRDFARTLPGQPLDNPTGPADYADVIQRLQRENEQLRSALASARVAAGFSPRPPADAVPAAGEEVPAQEASPTNANPVTAADETPVVADNSTPEVETPAEDPTPATRPMIQLPQPKRPSPTPATATAGGRRHVVKQKESLYSIARQYYGSASSAKVEEIFQANRNVLRTKADLHVGMELKIP